MKNCLIIFTRKPEKGQVKTRLAKGVGDDKALKIYQILLQHTAKITAKVDAHKQVFYTKNIVKNDVWNDQIFDKHLQSPGDLGKKMQKAFEQAFQDGFQKVIIIGSDLYDIDHTLIDKAFARLDTNEVVIGPAVDGGYYLLGMKYLMPQLFKDIDWSTEKVFQQTLNKILDKKIYLLHEKNDIDYKEDAMLFEDLKKIINS